MFLVGRLLVRGRISSSSSMSKAFLRGFFNEVVRLWDLGFKLRCATAWQEGGEEEQVT